MSPACAVHNLGLLDVELLSLDIAVFVWTFIVLTSIGRHFLKDPSGFDSICCPVNTDRRRQSFDFAEHFCVAAWFEERVVRGGRKNKDNSCIKSTQ